MRRDHRRHLGNRRRLKQGSKRQLQPELLNDLGHDPCSSERITFLIIKVIMDTVALKLQDLLPTPGSLSFDY